MDRSFRKSHREELGIPFPLDTAGYRWAVKVSGYDSARVTVRRYGDWTTGQITIKQSEDGVNGQTIGAGLTIGPPASGVLSITSDEINVQNMEYLILTVGTAEAGVSCDAIVHGRRTTPL